MKKPKAEKKFFGEIDYLSETYHLGSYGNERGFDTEKEMDDAMQNEDFGYLVSLCSICETDTEPKKRFIAKLKGDKNRRTYLFFCSQECLDSYFDVPEKYPEDNPEDEIMHLREEIAEILKPQMSEILAKPKKKKTKKKE